MYQTYRHFIHGIAVTWFGRAGVILTTSSFIAFLFLEFARVAGMVTNQYVGLITYLLFPSLFVAGLMLIPLGWITYRRREGKTTREILAHRLPDELNTPGFWGSRFFLTVMALSLLNVIFLLAASARTLHFMDQSVFCGTACHKVMNPEWVVYQDSPHARVACVECHVGEGLDALIASKMEGARQMFLAMFDWYQRPIPTPVHQLRPTRETCEKCHWPEKFYGRRLKKTVSFTDGEESSPRYTTLSLKIDTGTSATMSGIHWHIAPSSLIRYASVKDKREDIIWVEAKQPDGTAKRYSNKKLFAEDSDRFNKIRTMDCVDCHNRATHIYEEADTAIDLRLSLGQIDKNIPWIRQIALEAISVDYPDETTALESIEHYLLGYYQRHAPDVIREHMEELNAAVEVCRTIYRRNIHHGMKVTWGTYPSHIGHKNEKNGCFRCHNQAMVSDDGAVIGHDCTRCHSILANRADQPFAYLEPHSEDHPESIMRQFLRDEFLSSY